MICSILSFLSSPNKIFEEAFEWRIEFPEVLDEAGRFVGFDCVIGNPPYIQLQKMGDGADALQKMGYKTYKSTGDVYCLFYEIGLELLKPKALLSFITSNKWMRADYGKQLRALLATHYNPFRLIDFAGFKVFDSATVDVNILNVENSFPSKHTLACSIRKEGFDITKLSDYVQHHETECTFNSSDSWVILSPIEQSIKRKIEAVGTPLKDWDIQIYRGVLTGCNEAFIISTEKRNEILANCQSEDERKRTDELIRPILRGRDIKRYGYDWANLWLINTHNGIKDKIPRIHIEDYPAVKAHLDLYWNKISKRADKGDTPYNLRNCAYLEDFSKPKIMWKRIGSILRFCFNENGALGLDSTCFAAGPYAEYLCCVLNSPMGHYLLKDSPKTGTGDLLVSVQAIEPLRIPTIKEEDRIKFKSMLSNISCVNSNKEREINSFVFEKYKLDEHEVDYILRHYS